MQRTFWLKFSLPTILCVKVRDGEMVAVELVARDAKGTVEAVLSLGCVQYEPVKRVYDAR